MAFLVLLLVSSLSSVFGEECACGIENSASRIIGGTAVPDGKYPWMAFLLIETTEGSFQCGGAIINDNYILTAGHCLDDATGVTVGVGSIYDSSENEMQPTESFFQHPDYTKNPPTNDIALVKLATPLTWSKKIRPICLPTADMSESGELTVAGWGVKNVETDETSNVLLETKVEEYDFEKCNNDWWILDSSSQFCAALIGHDSCGGDSGGPLWKRVSGKNYAVGVVSFGVKVCASTRSSVYTKVSHFLDWIHENTSDGKYCSN